VDQKEEAEEGEADTGAGCLGSAPQVWGLAFSTNQEELLMLLPLINHNYGFVTLGAYRVRATGADMGAQLSCCNSPCFAAISREKQE